MKVNTNIASLTAQRHLASSTRAIARALERLSTGKRINRAGDDAAGLAISSRLQAEARGIDQSIKNINEAYSVLQVADGAISVQLDIAQRMRELAVYAANGTLSDQDRRALNNDMQQLIVEYNRIAEQTTYGATPLLNGSYNSLDIQVGTQKHQTISINIDSTAATASTEITDTTVYTGTGTWSETATYLGSQSGRTYFDINQDGIGDLFSPGRSAGNGEYIYFGNSNGTFSLVSSSDIGRITQQSFVDLNNDNHMDFVAVSEVENNFKTFLGDGNGGFVQSQTIAAASVPAIKPLTGDFDEDGNADAIFLHNNTIVLYTGNGDGTMTFDSTVQASSTASSLTDAVDLDQDGNLDIVGVSSAGYAVIYYGDGAGSFSPLSTIDLAPSGLTLSDLDGDGDLDFFSTDSTGNGRIYTVLNLGPRSYSGYLLSDAVGVQINSTGSVGDFTGDGIADAILSTSGTTYLYAGLGNGYFNLTAEETFVGDYVGMNAGSDLNGDNVSDIVLYERNLNFWSIRLQDTTSTGSVETTTIELPHIETQTDAQDSLETIDSMITHLSSVRANLGAQMNRLEFARANNQVLTENLSNARSQILDADLALETSELTRAQILQQAGVSVLGQANLSLQIALQLLNKV